MPTPITGVASAEFDLTVETTVPSGTPETPVSGTPILASAGTPGTLVTGTPRTNHAPPGPPTPVSFDADVTPTPSFDMSQIKVVAARPTAVVTFQRPNCRTAFPIDQVEPGTIRSVVRGMTPGAGTSALWILETATKGCFILKADDMVDIEHATTEYFGAGFGSGAVPKTRLLNTAEYLGAIKDMFLANSTATELTQLTDIPFVRQISSSQQTQILLMEFRAGAKSFNDIRRAQAIGSDMAAPFDGKRGRIRLFYLGMIAAYDLVIYNNDRLPGIGTMSFNQGNLMMENTGGAIRPVPIDNTTAQNLPNELATERERRRSSNSGQALPTNIAEGLDIDALLDKPAKINDLAATIVTRLPIRRERHLATQALARGIREGFSKLATDDQAAGQELAIRLQNSDRWIRAGMVGGALQKLRAKSGQLALPTGLG